MRGAILAIWIVCFLTIPSFAQLDAPGALSDSSSCSHDTCTWVPFFIPKTFRRSNYTYSVDAHGEETGGTFVLQQNGATLLKVQLPDLSASVSVVWSRTNDAFAITWSNGGSIGVFNVEVFQFLNGTAHEVPAIDKAVAEFKSRHYCQERGNNVQAYRWLSSEDLLIVTSVYPTGDCGPDLGHTEAYVVHTQDGSIVRHLTLKELKVDMKKHPE
jgi:hypothetical protein